MLPRCTIRPRPIWVGNVNIRDGSRKAIAMPEEKVVMHEIHESLDAHFTDVVETGFGKMKLVPGLNGQGTLEMTQHQAKRLADAIYQKLGLPHTS